MNLEIGWHYLYREFEGFQNTTGACIFQIFTGTHYMPRPVVGINLHHWMSWNGLCPRISGHHCLTSHYNNVCAHTHTHPWRCSFVFKSFPKEKKNWAVSKSLPLLRKAEFMNVSLIYLRCYPLWIKGFYATWLWKESAYGNSEKKRKLF